MLGRIFGKTSNDARARSEKGSISSEARYVITGGRSSKTSELKTKEDMIALLQSNDIAEDEESTVLGRNEMIALRSADLDKDHAKQVFQVMEGALDKDEMKDFLGAAAAYSADTLIEAAVEQQGPAIRDPETLTFMAENANRRDRSETFALLKNAGAEHPNSELYVAIRTRSYDQARWIMANGFDPEEINENGNTLLHAAGLAQSPSLMKDVMAKDEQPWINARNADGKTFLSMVFDDRAQHGVDSLGYDFPRENEVLDMIEIASNAGFDFTAIDNDGNTIMHDLAGCHHDISTCWYGRNSSNMIESALDHRGIDKRHKNNEGLSVGDIASSHYSEKMSPGLIRSGYLPTTDETYTKAIDNCLKAGDGDALKMIEDQGKTWTDRLGGDDLAPFHVVMQAAKSKSDFPIKAARDAGLSFDVRNEKSETPFSVARDLNCKGETLDTLKEIKIDIIARDLRQKAQGRANTRADLKKARQTDQEAR